MRLIDADALIAEIVKTTSFVKDSMLFQKMVDEAPTVSAEAVQRWIPVSERLPEKDEEVLITAWGSVEGVAWVDNYGLWQTETYTFHNNEDVTAWMPLPKPYREESEVEE